MFSIGLNNIIYYRKNVLISLEKKRKGRPGVVPRGGPVAIVSAAKQRATEQQKAIPDVLPTALLFQSALDTAL